ncbi:aminotransferase [Polychytrium aggregatum]|uniref:aminotransferase n=1 Tax=Polychytrium aggregatum TaxID=110093 RepID=UPI0022FE95DF|nr:aminotransferase [Polychytrium aggregatum]KAI9209122.1 aminotransferase [Polychytrium aggregatum]
MSPPLCPHLTLHCFLGSSRCRLVLLGARHRPMSTFIAAESRLVLDDSVVARPFEPAAVSSKPSIVNAKDFLLQSPRGVYTTARSVNSYAIMDLSAHLARLATSLQGMQLPFESADAAPAEATPPVSKTLGLMRNPEHNSTWIAPVIRQSMAHYYRLVRDSGESNLGEAKITALITYSPAGKIEIRSHCEKLPQLSLSSCRVAVYGMPRKTASVKDSQWVLDRAHLESSKAPGVHEVLLIDSQNNIYEGLSSNFAVLKKDSSGTIVLQTAPLTTVLPGTVLKMITGVCASLGIPVVYEFPNVRDRHEWLSAFISSTSRGALCVSSIDFPDER